jgi:hypothetical protein
MARKKSNGKEPEKAARMGRPPMPAEKKKRMMWFSGSQDDRKDIESGQKRLRLGSFSEAVRTAIKHWKEGGYQK